MLTVAQTAATVGAQLAKPGAWSHELPVVIDDAGNITATCVATEIARTEGANPGIWERLTRKLQQVTGSMIGISPLLNKHPDMTQEKMVGALREVEQEARAEGV